jgi:hypothetical protein
MRKGDAKEAVYLNDSNIIEWDRPSRIQRPDLLCIKNRFFSIPDASTELLNYIGFDVLDKTIGKYHLVASSAKYNAKIAIMGKNFMREREEETTNKPENLILFAGSIAIYSIDQIPGTELKGYDFIRHGEIFTARKGNDILKSNRGLKHLVLEGLEGGKAVERVEKIITGYENDHLAEQKAQRKRVHNAYQKGDLDTREEVFGTFG